MDGAEAATATTTGTPWRSGLAACFRVGAGHLVDRRGARRAVDRYGLAAHGSARRAVVVRARRLDRLAASCLPERERGCRWRSRRAWSARRLGAALGRFCRALAAARHPRTRRGSRCDRERTVGRRLAVEHPLKRRRGRGGAWTGDSPGRRGPVGCDWARGAVRPLDKAVVGAFGRDRVALLRRRPGDGRGILTGSETDPGMGPLLILLVVSLYPFHRSRQPFGSGICLRDVPRRAVDVVVTLPAGGPRHGISLFAHRRRQSRSADGRTRRRIRCSGDVASGRKILVAGDAKRS